MDDSKKIDIQQDEYALPVSATDTPTPVLPTHPAYNPKGLDEKALVRKIDWRLIPWLSVLYLLSFLDRTSIGNANTFHLSKDLKLSDQQYLLCLTIFFIPYALFEPISNVLLKRLSPRWWLSGIMVLWGVAMLGQGFVTNYQQLLAVRFLLGLAEAGLFPGVTYLLSCWYSRGEIGLRTSIFFSAATASGAFGSLLAVALQKLGGTFNRPGWAQIFIWEGVLTIVCALASPWLIPDFPEEAKFLTEDERDVVIGRLQTDSVEATGEKFSWKSMRASLFDWKTWAYALIYAGSDMPLYAFSLFTPTIISQLGYSAVRANLISVPIYVVACIVTVALGFYADKTRTRGKWNLILMGVGIIGYIILIASPIPGLSYAAVFLAACGIYPLIPNTIVWAANNTQNAYKRSLTMGLIIGFGNLNGAVSSNVYRKADSPQYRLGHGLVLLYLVMGWVGTALVMIMLKRENAKRDRGERDEIISADADEKTRTAEGERIYSSHEEAKRVLGDLHSSVRYVL